MPHQMFQIVTANPNDVTGGGGCVCDPQRQIDCRPPYAVFSGNDMENIASPHVVICAGCAEAVVAKCQGEALAGGETGRTRKPDPHHWRPGTAPHTLPRPADRPELAADEDVPEV